MSAARLLPWVLGILTCLCLSGCATSKTVDVAEAQLRPQNVIQAFIQALESNNIEMMSRLATPARQDNINNRAWRRFWREYELVELSSTIIPQAPPADGAERTVRVKATFRHKSSGAIVDDSVTVSQIGGQWYWDEN